MKTYRLSRDANHAYTLLVVNSGYVRLPMLISSDQRPAWPMLTVAMTLLLDYFDGEEQAELKATLMARALVHFLNRLGDTWTITEAELNNAVMTVLVTGKTVIDEVAEDICIEHVTGERRDTLRQEG
jgi:hypothetical protein